MGTPRSPESVFRERELQTVWERRLFRPEGLLTEDARPLVVDFPGLRSVEGGPDFRGARLRIGGRPILGDVEMHLTTDGWRHHGHGKNGAYDGVVLHVALERGRDVGTAAAPELILAPHLDRSRAELARDVARPVRPLSETTPAELDRLGEVRFDRRVASLRLRIERTGLLSAFWREVLIALGYKHNKAGFEELARLVPLESLQGLDESSIEARLRSEASGVRWRTRGVRPANRPLRRMAGLARWLGSVGTERPEASHLERPLSASFDPRHSGLIGRDRDRQMAANVSLPIAVAAGSPEQAASARDLFRTASAGPANRRIRDGMGTFGFARPETLRREWGVMEFLACDGTYRVLDFTGSHA